MISLDKLEKRFGATSVVKGLSLEIAPGELVALLGPSGCGKTTTLRMIAGLERPDGGAIRIDGREVAGPNVFVPPEERGLGMVFQSYAIWPHKSVEANVAYPLERKGMPRAELARRVKEALGWVRLEAFATRRPHELSGGQLQRVALARALVAGPRVLLLDEPLSNLDAALREQLRAEIAGLRSRFQMTMVYVTHDQAEALAISDRIAVMNKGVIEQLDDPRTLYAEPSTPFVAGFVGGANVLNGAVLPDGAFVCGGSRFSLPNAEAQGPCTLVARPEDIALGVEGGTPLPLSARLFLGNAFEYRFPLPGTEVLLRAVGPELPTKPGESVPVRLARARLFR